MEYWFRIALTYVAVGALLSEGCMRVDRKDGGAEWDLFTYLMMVAIWPLIILVTLLQNTMEKR